MKLRFDLPDDAEQVTVVARFREPAARKTMVFLLEFQSAEGKAVTSKDVGWSVALKSNFAYCPDVRKPETKKIASLSVPNGVSALQVKVAPWQTDESVVKSVERLHALVQFDEPRLKMTCAGVEQ